MRACSSPAGALQQRVNTRNTKTTKPRVRGRPAAVSGKRMSQRTQVASCPWQLNTLPPLPRRVRGAAACGVRRSVRPRCCVAETSGSALPSGLSNACTLAACSPAGRAASRTAPQRRLRHAHAASCARQAVQPSRAAVQLTRRLRRCVQVLPPPAASDASVSSSSTAVRSFGAADWLRTLDSLRDRRLAGAAAEAALLEATGVLLRVGPSRIPEAVRSIHHSPRLILRSMTRALRARRAVACSWRQAARRRARF
jgi:hypothetical protein